MSRRIALFGGSFNPIHFGHLITARSVAEHVGADGVVFLPSAQPPHKAAGSLLSGEHRAAMVRLAIEGEPGFEFSDHDLLGRGRTYTIDTVSYFRETLGAETELYWIIGADSLAELGTWHRVGDLVDSCHVVTAARPGWDNLDSSALRQRLSDAQVAKLKVDVLRTPRIDISATSIRQRIREGRSIRFLTPDKVVDYILVHGLYRNAVAGE